MKAFPTTIKNHTSYGKQGMDLRDYFAARAMQSIIIYEEGDFNLKLIAEESYRMADEMIKARENNKSEGNMSEPIANTEQLAEPVAVRYDFDGYGYKYMDAGNGSDWASRVKNCEFLYTHPMVSKSADMLQKQAKEIEALKDKLGIQDYSDNSLLKAVSKIKEQAKEISSLKKQINLLVVSREPKISDRVILLDDESEGVIESLSINGYAAINFDDGCYGNYTKVELITLFAYKESE